MNMMNMMNINMNISKNFEDEILELKRKNLEMEKKLAQSLKNISLEQATALILAERVAQLEPQLTQKENQYKLLQEKVQKLGKDGVMGRSHSADDLDEMDGEKGRDPSENSESRLLSQKTLEFQRKELEFQRKDMEFQKQVHQQKKQIQEKEKEIDRMKEEVKDVKKKIFIGVTSVKKSG